MASLRDWELPMEQIAPLIRERIAQGGEVRLSPRGISMLPMLRQGRDSVVLSPVKAPLKKYDIILYQRDNGAYVLHRIVKVGKTLTCIGDNQFEKESGVLKSQVIAVVSSFYREGKQIMVKNPSYQLYCRLWHASRILRRVKRRIEFEIKKRAR